MTFFQYIQCTKGATVIEYVLLAAGIGLAILAVTIAFGVDLGALYENLSATTTPP